MSTFSDKSPDLENGEILNEFQRMHKRAKEVLGEYYNQEHIDGATAFHTEKSWGEIMDRVEKALKDVENDEERKKSLTPIYFA